MSVHHVPYLSLVDSCYRATVGLNLVAAIVILTTSVPPVVRAMFSIPNIALQNAMACRVYRQLKVGLIRDQPSPVVVTSRISAGTMQFSRSGVTTKHHDPSQVESHISLQNMNGTLRSKGLNVPELHVGISRESEVSTDSMSNNTYDKGWKGGEIA